MDNKGGVHLSKKQSKYKLEVAGTGLLVTGDSTGKGPLVFGPDGGGKGFRMDYEKSKMYFGHSDGKKVHMVMTDKGLVGVGIPNPSSAMHIKHDSGIAIQHGTKADKWTVSTHSSANLDFAYMKQKQISFTKKGFVGIGTTKPKKQLHVEGDVYVSGKMHVDNYYTKKLAAQGKEAPGPSSSKAPKGAKAAPKKPTKKPKLERLTSAEAFIQLDEHVSARMEDNSVGLVHVNEQKEAEPVDLTSLVTYMHRVAQEQQAQIKELRERVAMLEKKA